MDNELLTAWWDGEDLTIRMVEERYIGEGDVVINKSWTIEQVLRLAQAEYNRHDLQWVATGSGECHCGGNHTTPARIAEPMIFGGANGLWSQVVR